MHHVLERMDFRNPDPVFMKECLDRAFGAMAPTYRKEAGEILQRFTESGLCLKLRKAGRVFRELPFILGERHGMIHGVIDLLYQDGAGDWHVVDYKTAVGDEAKVEASGYRTQIELYGLAVHRLLGKAPRSGVLFFLKNGWEYGIEWKPGELEKTGDRIRAMQESLLGPGQFSSDSPGQL